MNSMCFMTIPESITDFCIHVHYSGTESDFNDVDSTTILSKAQIITLRLTGIHCLCIYK